MNLEPSLRDIEPNPGNLVDLMWSPVIRSTIDLFRTTLNRVAGAVHIISDAARARPEAKHELTFAPDQSLGADH